MESIPQEATGQLTLTSDSWTNQRTESVINYVATTRQHAIFLKSEVTESERHTGKMIARGLVKIMEELGGESAVVAITTDNASNMRAACAEVEQHYPAVITLGCASHTVNLTVEEILRSTPIIEAVNLAISLVKYFKNSTILTGALTEAANRVEETRISLKLPGKTRWQGKVDVVSSLITNKQYIRRVLEDRKLCLGGSPTAINAANYEWFFALAHNSGFWENTDSVYHFLKPFLEVTIALESNKPKASRLFAYFNYLLNRTRAITSPLIAEDISGIIRRRWDKMQHPLFTVAYICDPTSRNEHQVEVTEEQKLAAASWLEQNYSPVVASALFQELEQVWARNGSYSSDIVRNSFHNCLDPADWKDQRACSADLKSLAVYALSINPTTGAAERNWPVHSFLHSKVRNLLGNPPIQKLVYLFQNLRVRDSCLSVKPTYFDENEVDMASNEEEEIETKQDNNEMSLVVGSTTSGIDL